MSAVLLSSFLSFFPQTIVTVLSDHYVSALGMSPLPFSLTVWVLQHRTLYPRVEI
jgi:hypothetical protein